MCMANEGQRPQQARANGVFLTEPWTTRTWTLPCSRALRARRSEQLTALATALEELLGRLDSAPSGVRDAAAWTAEKFGRLKLNGRILRPSPLSGVTELEGCRILLESNRALWTGLAHLAVGPADAADRARRAERLLEAAERLRLDALHPATHGRVDAPGDPR